VAISLDNRYFTYLFLRLAKLMIYFFYYRYQRYSDEIYLKKKIVLCIIWAASRAFRYSSGKKMRFRYVGQGASSGRSCTPASPAFFLPGAATSIAAAGFLALHEVPSYQKNSTISTPFP